MFETTTHGEKFDRRGNYYGGPAQKGLDRYPVTVKGSSVFVDFDRLIGGPNVQVRSDRTGGSLLRPGLERSATAMVTAWESGHLSSASRDPCGGITDCLRFQPARVTARLSAVWLHSG
jgi:hypothetical protein